MPHILGVESTPPSATGLWKVAGGNFGALHAGVLTALRGDVTTRITTPMTAGR